MPAEVTPAAAPAAQPAVTPAATTQPAAQPQAELTPEAKAVEKASAAMRTMLDKKPGQKPVEQKPAEGADKDTEEMEKVVKSNPKAWRVYEGFKKSTAQKLAEYEKKLSDLQSKPNPTVADDSKIKAMEARIAEIEGEAKSAKQKLAEYDYRNSEDFQTKFVQTFKKVYERGVQFTKGLKVLDDLGEVSRDATQQDFDEIRSLPAQQRRKVATERFGDAAFDVLQYIAKMDEIRSDADEALQNHEKNHEKTVAERKAKEETDAKAFDGFKGAVQRELESKYPEYFSPDHYKDQPELKQHLEDGYKFVDEVASNSSKMDREDLAANTSVIRARAGAFPLMWARVEALKAENAKLKEELGGVAASDPGSRKAAKAASGAAPTEVGGIDAMAKQFDE